MEACHIIFYIWGLGVYSASDVLNYVFLASRLQSAGLQTKLLRHTSIVSPEPIFDEALSVFNTSMETDLLSNPKSTFSLSPRQMALWTSQMEDHISDRLRTVHISGSGQTMNDHAVSCAGIIGIKHRHNVVRDTLVDVCYRYGIYAGKEVDIELDEGCDKPLRPADILLYSWDGGLDVCVILTGSSHLMQIRMVDFVPGRAMIDAVQRKRDKYMAKCAALGYEFLPLFFSSLEELEADACKYMAKCAVLEKFSMSQDTETRAAVHIFNRIRFAIAKRVGAQIVSRLPSNLL
nr:hypothetical protein [Tanacetum cinerariifolium]